MKITLKKNQSAVTLVQKLEMLILFPERKISSCLNFFI